MIKGKLIFSSIPGGVDVFVQYPQRKQMTLNPQNLALNFHFWECPRCSFHNSNRVTTCKTCSSDRDGPTGAAEQLPLDQVILRNNLRILKYNFIILLYHVLYIDLCLPLSNMSPSLFSLL